MNMYLAQLPWPWSDPRAYAVCAMWLWHVPIQSKHMVTTNEMN